MIIRPLRTKLMANKLSPRSFGDPADIARVPRASYPIPKIPLIPIKTMTFSISSRLQWGRAMRNSFGANFSSSKLEFYSR